MKILKLFIIILFFFTSCYTNKKNNTIEQVYDFAETIDENYCNKYSIINTDCGGGTFYFTKTGFVFYTFYCYGSDTTSFLIGKYAITNNEAVCVFDKNYSFYNGFNGDNDPLPFDRNCGTIKRINTKTLKLQKISCEYYDFSFNENNSKFVLNKASKAISQNYIDELKTINKLEAYLK